MVRDTNKFVCLTFHTERLHDNRVWEQVKSVVGFLNSRDISASWFSIAPIHPAYVERKFSLDKWASRLKELSRMNQSIEQHTHFYKATKGPYDLSWANLEKRLLEDKSWLESQGFNISGFVAGGWAVSKDLLKLLVQHGFVYDCSVRASQSINSFMVTVHPARLVWGAKHLVEVPTSSALSLRRALSAFFRRSGGESHFDNLKDIIIFYLHDYDLTQFKSRMALVTSIVLLSRKYSFITTRELIGYLDPDKLPVVNLEVD